MMLAGARAMFISGHDLSLLLTMLTFAAVLSVGFGLLYAMPLASRIERVRKGTARIAGGELESEVPVEGHDEVKGTATDGQSRGVGTHHRDATFARYRSPLGAVLESDRLPAA
jgi:signal transduction histidine kinase